MGVTAKAQVSFVQEVSWNNTPVSLLRFSVDYADGANKEWATATPSLNLEMAVKREIAEKYFPLGRKVTLTFEDSE